MEKIRKFFGKLFARDSRGRVHTVDSTDVTLVCKDGHQVRTEAGLLVPDKNSDVSSDFDSKENIELAKGQARDEQGGEDEEDEEDEEEDVFFFERDEAEGGEEEEVDQAVNQAVKSAQRAIVDKEVMALVELGLEGEGGEGGENVFELELEQKDKEFDFDTYAIQF